MADVSVKPRIRPIIYAWGDFGPDSVTGRWGANTYPNEAVAYVPQDLSDARVAAAYEAAADVVSKTQLNRPAAQIRNLTPDDAKAALDQMIAEAVEAEREACARIVEKLYGKDCAPEEAIDAGEGYDLALDDAANAIRARGEDRDDE